MSKVRVRPFQKDDAGFVFSTWSKGAYHGAESKPQVNKQQWFKQHYLYVCDAIEQGEVRIACLADDPNTILGYSVVHGGKLQWVYVKQDFRRLGIGKMLETFHPVSEVHLTKIGRSILTSREERTRDEERSKKNSITDSNQQQSSDVGAPSADGHPDQESEVPQRSH